MPKYHMTNAGQAGLCQAKSRACPLGGEHYDSFEEADLASYETDFAAETQAYQDHWDQNIGEVEAVFQEPARMGPQSDTSEQESIEQLTTIMLAQKEPDTAEGDRVYAELCRRLETGLLEDQEEVMDAIFAAAPDLRANNNLAISFNDELLRLEKQREALNALLDGWEDERFDLDEALYERDIKPVTEDELIEFQSHEDQATSVVMNAVKDLDSLDRARSMEAAEELQTYAGMKTLDLLAADIADQAHEDFAAGRITQEELEEAVYVAGALRYLLNPAEGRRHTKREARPIDPELIQALRCLYTKRFGVDPFEQGVSVPQLLQMRQQRLI